MQFEDKIIKDTSGDENEISVLGGEVRLASTVGSDETTMYFTPKKARKFAVALIEAAAVVEASQS